MVKKIILKNFFCRRKKVENKRPRLQALEE